MNDPLTLKPAIAVKLQELAKLKNVIYHQTIEIRKQTAAAHAADFPFGLLRLPASDAQERP